MKGEVLNNVRPDQALITHEAHGYSLLSLQCDLHLASVSRVLNCHVTRVTISNELNEGQEIYTRVVHYQLETNVCFLANCYNLQVTM